jgi:hypothetical protein
MRVVAGWRSMNADMAAMTRLREAKVNVPPAKMPINSGLRMKTHDP